MNPPKHSETLPNGIHVQMLNVDEPKPWIASITIGPWYYCQGGATKEEAIAALFPYMKKYRKEWIEAIKMYQERINALDKFLDTEPK